MANSGVITPILTLVLGGGISAAVLNLVRAKNENKKAPAERDAVVVTSAETAVVIMQKVLDATNSQLKVKENEVAELQTKLHTVRTELKELRERCEEMEELLDVIQREHPVQHTEQGPPSGAPASS